MPGEFKEPQQEPTEKQENFLDAEDYLKRVAIKDNNISEKDLQESLDRLSKLLGKVDYKDADSVEVSDGNVEFGFSYSAPEKELNLGIERYASKYSSDVDFNKDYFNVENWKKLTSLSFQSGDVKKDLLAFLPENYSVVFCPTKEYSHGAVDSSCIYILGDMATPRSIITLLHEMGHIFDYMNKDRVQIGGSLLHHGAAESVRRERTASAFVFRVMRPFLKDAQIKGDVINLLKNYALESYNLSATEEFHKIEKQKPYLERVVRRAEVDWQAQEQEMEEQRLWDDFLAWRKTEEYNKWKEKDENKNMDIPEEFVEWRDLIEKDKNK